jgi:ankyrin repeat protein
MRTPLLLLLALTLACTSRQNERPSLVSAARSGDDAAVRALCARGADPDQASGRNGWSPLLHAVHTNQLGTTAALLDCGASIDRAAPNGTTPLMMAAGYGDDAMVRLLLARGADAKLRDQDGSAAVDYALTGVIDIDAFTFFRCQTETADLLTALSPPPTAETRRWSHLKRCT